MYNLNFKNEAVDITTKRPIQVPVGGLNNTATSLTFTGKGAANYGTVQQENLIRLLENFADSTEPLHPTIGQLWYDSGKKTLKVLMSVEPREWRAVGGTQIRETPPDIPAIGDTWFDPTGSASGIMYLYTGVGRYPEVNGVIGGWEQIYPAPQVLAGRDEYDEMLMMVMQIVGTSMTTWGSGVLASLSPALTDFGALDRSLRTKYKAVVLASGAQDLNVINTTVDDTYVTPQALGNNAYIWADAGNTLDPWISGSLTASVNASLHISESPRAIPAGSIPCNQFVDDAFIAFKTDTTRFLKLNSAGATLINSRYAVVKYDDDQQSWVFDSNGAGWVPFEPNAETYLIGTFSSFHTDNGIYPGSKNAFVWQNAFPMVGAKYEHLRVEPNSQDWDKLLAALKFGLKRLDLPNSFLKAVSELPFVYDGRPAPAELTALPTSDIRYPSGRRRTRVNPGMMTYIQRFNETLNSINAGIASRFNIRGINGVSSSHPNFDASVSVGTPFLTKAAPIKNGGYITFYLRFASRADKYQWIASGQGVEITLLKEPGTAPADALLDSIITQYGLIRITADAVRFFDPLQLPSYVPSLATTDLGFWNANSSLAAPQTLATVTNGTASMGIGVSYTDSDTDHTQERDLRIRLNFVLPSNCVGSTTIGVSLIKDDTTLTDGSKMFPQPLAFVEAADLINQL